jgi:hypothetical protein
LPELTPQVPVHPSDPHCFPAQLGMHWQVELTQLCEALHAGTHVCAQIEGGHSHLNEVKLQASGATHVPQETPHKSTLPHSAPKEAHVTVSLQTHTPLEQVF